MPLLQSRLADATFDPMLLLLAALALEPLLGEARGPLGRLPHPVRLIGALVSLLDGKLNREDRSEADRRGRGVLLVLFVCALAAAVGLGIAWLSRHLPLGWLLELALIISLLAQRSLFRHVRQVGEALRGCGIEAGRAQVAHIVGRDVKHLDEHGIARAAIEVLRRELLRRGGGTRFLVHSVRRARNARLQGCQHHGQHDRLSRATLPRVRLGGGAAG